MSKNTRGFIQYLILAAVLIFIGVVAVIVFLAHSNKNNIPASTAAQSKATDNNQNSISTQSVSTLTYTSLAGKFSFKYPSSWSLNGYSGELPTDKVSGNETTIVIAAPVDTSDPGVGQYIVSLSIITPNASVVNHPNPYASTGSSTELTNGIDLWTSNLPDTNNVDPNAGRLDCAYTIIIGKDSTPYYYGYPLRSGLYLDGEGGYCLGQKSTTSLTYAMQMVSAERLQGLEIFKSIEFQ